jgi:DNA-binding CsgD family transcriptional regulator
MNISTQAHMQQLSSKLNCFGYFDISFLQLNKSGNCYVLSSLPHKLSSNAPFVLSNRFHHFLRLMQSNTSKFFSEKTNFFEVSPFLKDGSFVAFIKITPTDKIKIYLFHAEKRSEVVHLLLHKDVMKRMALYMDENMSIKNVYCHTDAYRYLFEYEGVVDYIEKDQRYLKCVFDGLLTKKENKLVCSYLQSHSIKSVSEQVGFSRSYVSQLLLSSAHKLGLSRIHDILSIDKTSGVLLRQGE